MLKEALIKKNILLSKDEVIGIYGTGLAGGQVYTALADMNIPVGFFLDGDSRKTGDFFCGKEIIDLKDAAKEAVILIAADPAYGIHERLEKADFHRWDYIDPGYLSLYSSGYNEKTVGEIYRLNQDKIRCVYDELADEKSKETFAAVLEHRRVHDLSLIDRVYDKNQYFGNDVIGSVNGNFADCGAFTGDTLQRFMKQVKGEYHYYAFEADRENCDAIKAYCNDNDISNVSIYNIAVYDERKQLVFQQDYNDEKVCGRVSESEDTKTVSVQGDSLDHVLGQSRVDMITMDIEGAELRAINGAAACISMWHPRLAVSAYHSVEHLWEIPLLIKQMAPDYKIYYRHHRWNMHDTVCYAI